MSTRVGASLVALGERLDEVGLLLTAAETCENTDKALYASLCRSAQVFLCAHFEGYLNDLIESSLADVNTLADFKAGNPVLKRKMAEYFTKPADEPNPKGGKEIEERTRELISLFETTNPRYERKHLRLVLKNPKESVLNKVCSRYGIEDLMDNLMRSKLDVVFSNTNAENRRLANELKQYASRITRTYPYPMRADYLKVRKDEQVSDNFWNTFLNEFLTKRHNVVHGRERTNVDGHSTIRTSKVKLEILIYAFTIVVCAHCNPPDKL